LGPAPGPLPPWSAASWPGLAWHLGTLVSGLLAWPGLLAPCSPAFWPGFASWLPGIWWPGLLAALASCSPAFWPGFASWLPGIWWPGLLAPGFRLALPGFLAHGVWAPGLAWPSFLALGLWLPGPASCPWPKRCLISEREHERLARFTTLEKLNPKIQE